MSLDQNSVFPASRLRAGSGHGSDASRLVEALTVELAGEKIDLPSFPEVAVRVRKALTNDQVVIDHVVRVISAEPALAARLMQLANSAALNASGKRLTDLRTAISRIGFNMARSATIAFAMSQLRRAEAYKGLDEPLTELWHHSAHVAAVSHVVAKRFTQVNADTALLAGLLQGVGKLYLLTRASRFPALLQDVGTYQRLVAEWHGRVAAAILRNWEMAEEVVTAAIASENMEREHEGATDLTDVLAVGSALAALGPDPQAEQMLFLGMPAARRMKLDSKSCAAALAESHGEITSLRQALGA
ncbi:MAG TPA: HDOD domain-containing protein [Steroidobacteraceae bacterium]|jgi:HD-like signal output (HDOD) protein|nr:HDOD domain-containing protein [Steroidobacteraceae bacterium]